MVSKLNFTANFGKPHKLDILCTVIIHMYTAFVCLGSQQDVLTMNSVLVEILLLRLVLDLVCAFHTSTGG